MGRIIEAQDEFSGPGPDGEPSQQFPETQPFRMRFKAFRIPWLT